MNETCLGILGSMERFDGPIFRSHSGRKLSTDDLRRALIRVARAAGFVDLTRVHDLRHTFSSQMQMKGIDPGTVATILGHRGIETTAIYTHQTAEHLKVSINMIQI